MKQPLFAVIGVLLLGCFLAACGGTAGSSPPSSSSRSQPVQISETDFKIDSSVATFSTGVHYHFIVTNHGKTAHEFMIMPRSEGNMSGMSMGDMDKLALAAIDNIPPGETRTLDYTFPTAAAVSHPEFACYLPGHYEVGMKLDVTVKPQ